MEARTLVDIVPRLLSRIEVQGGVKEDNNIELPLRGIFHIRYASPPPFAPSLRAYSPCRVASSLAHDRLLPLFVRPLKSAPPRFFRSFSVHRLRQNATGCPHAHQSSLQNRRRSLRAKSQRGSTRYEREREIEAIRQSFIQFFRREIKSTFVRDGSNVNGKGKHFARLEIYFCFHRAN